MGQLGGADTWWKGLWQKQKREVRRASVRLIDASVIKRSFNTNKLVPSTHIDITKCHK